MRTYDSARRELHERTATASRGGLVGLVGPAGWGKTSLLVEVEQVARQRSLPVWSVCGRQGEQGVNGLGLEGVLGRAAVAKWRAETGLPAVELGYEVLDVCAGPGMLLVDDAQWLDDLSLGALTSVASRWTGEDRWLVVAHGSDPRPGLFALDAAIGRSRPMINLGVLDEAGVAAHVGRVLGCALDPVLLDHLMHLTAGVVRYVDLLAQGWRAEGIEAPRDGLPGIPSTVVEWIRIAIGRLSPDAQTLVRTLGAGASLNEPLVELAVGLDDEALTSAATELTSAGFSDPRAEPDLLPVVALVLGRLTPPSEARRMHRRVAEMLRQSNGPVLLIAEHYREAGDPGPNVVGAMGAAGDALLREAPELAAEWYGRALVAGGDPRVFAARRAEAAALMGNHAEAIALADPATADPNTPEYVRAMTVLAASVARVGYWVRSSRRYERLIGVVGDERQAAGSALFAAVGATIVGQLDRAHSLTQTMHGRLDRPAPLLLESWVCVLEGLNAAVGAHPERALEPFCEAVELMGSDRHLELVPDSPHAIAASIARQLHEFGLAERLLVQALNAGSGGPLLVDRHRLLLGWVALATGRWAAVDAVLEQVPDKDLPLREELLRVAIEAGVARRLGDIDRLHRIAPRVVDVLGRHPVDLLSFEIGAELYTAAIRAGRADAVADWPVRARTLLRDAGWPPLQSWLLDWSLFRAAMARGDATEARVLADAIRSRPAPTPKLAPLGAAVEAWVAVTEGSVDPVRVLAVTRDLQQVGLAWEAAQLAGAAASKATDEGVSRALLGQARELRAAIPIQETVDAPTASLLSDREVEVASRVLAGLTYKEIGGELYISPKTVEHHVARIRQRLGAETRAEFLAALRQILER